MGKGTIISHIADGQYNVTMTYKHDLTQALISRLTSSIAALDIEIAALPAGDEKERLKARRLSLSKQKTYLENNVIEDETITAWCADLTTDLTGDVGLIEIPGETKDGVLIQPGYDSNAVYNATRDGQMASALEGSSVQFAYNFAMMPGWQKWMPTYRFGTITDIDYDTDTCDITLDSAISSIQDININQSSTLTDVAIEYMTCNASAFIIDDDVVVKFTGQDWDVPVVIGFKNNPLACNDVIIDWDLLTNVQPVPYNNFPVYIRDNKPCVQNNPVFSTYYTSQIYPDPEVDIKFFFSNYPDPPFVPVQTYPVIYSSGGSLFFEMTTNTYGMIYVVVKFADTHPAIGQSIDLSCGVHHTVTTHTPLYFANLPYFEFNENLYLNLTTQGSWYNYNYSYIVGDLACPDYGTTLGDLFFVFWLHDGSQPVPGPTWDKGQDFRTMTLRIDPITYT